MAGFAWRFVRVPIEMSGTPPTACAKLVVLQLRLRR